MSHRDTLPRAWVRQPSGRRLDLLSPTPFDWEDKDLALGCARTYRWGGHSTWARPLSVAQHSLLVLELSVQAASTPLSKEACLRELLHDAEEGLIGFDPISPLKPILGPVFEDMMHRLTQSIFTRYGVTWWSPEEKKAHKEADWLAAASEAVHVAGWTQEEVHSVLGIKIKALEDDPLCQIYGGRPWEPWPATIASARFLEALTSLTETERSSQ